MTSRPERERQEREQLLQRGRTLQDDVQEEYLEVEENYTAVADLFVEHRNLINESTDVLLGQFSYYTAGLETLRGDHLRERIRWLEEHQADMMERNRELHALLERLNASRQVLSDRLDFLQVARDVHLHHSTPVPAPRIDFHHDGVAPYEVSDIWHGRLRPARSGNYNPYARGRG
jgi:hypothetical protein